jgi:redox-sensitive bicupin YhaK (pirin superfamily)
MSVKTKSQIFHSANSRGIANHGWLVSRHTFSFAGYYNPDRVNFGTLRVLNDDIVKPGMGFGTHPHDNMEIISIPISGSLAHKDSTGKEQEIKTGEVQIMSAGSGIEHSEYNYSKKEEVNFLQLWILPKELNIKPRYAQKNFSEVLNQNKLVTVVSPEDENALWINQDAELSLGKLKAGTSISHKLKYKDNGIYAFLIDGEAEINSTKLQQRDAVGFFDIKEISIQIHKESTLLLIEIPKIY